MTQESLTATLGASKFSFPAVSGGDPNTIDLLVVGLTLEKTARVAVPEQLPEGRETGIASVECIEEHLTQGRDLIRNLSPEDLKTRLKRTGECARTRLDLSEDVEALIVALFTWHGCICMAKSTRAADSIGNPYTRELRLRDYSRLKETWRQLERRGNRWVKYGVTLAKSFSEKRGDIVVNDWIEPDSPYWDETDSHVSAS